MTTSICAHCAQGRVLPGDPKGSFVDGAYFALAPATEAPPASGAGDGQEDVTVAVEPAVTAEAGGDAQKAPPKRAIVLLTDAFGLPLKNNKLLADALAEKVGCDVWVPDIFDGKPIIEESALFDSLPDTPGQRKWLDKLKFQVSMLPRLPRLISSRPSLIDKRVDTFIQKIRDERKYEKIGAVGYCMGGSAAIRLASKTLIDSAVVAHPGPASLAQMKAMKVPTSWICAEEDDWFGPQTREAAEAAFAERKDKPGFVEYEFVDYPGTVHGFAARPNFAILAVKEAFEKALEQTVSWFKKTL